MLRILSGISRQETILDCLSLLGLTLLFLSGPPPAVPILA